MDARLGSGLLAAGAEHEMETEASVGLPTTGQDAFFCDADANRAQHRSEDADVSRQVLTALSEPPAAETLDEMPRLEVVAMEAPSRQPSQSAVHAERSGFDVDSQTSNVAAAGNSLEQVPHQRQPGPADIAYNDQQEGERVLSIRLKSRQPSTGDVRATSPMLHAAARHDSSRQAELQIEQESHEAQPAYDQALSIDQQNDSQHGAEGLAEGEPSSPALCSG